MTNATNHTKDNRHHTQNLNNRFSMTFYTNKTVWDRVGSCPKAVPLREQE